MLQHGWPRGYYAKWNTLDKDKYSVLQFVYGIKKKTNHKHNKTETESLILRTNMWLPEGSGSRDEGNRQGRLRGTDFQLQNKWVMGMEYTRRGIQ